MTEWDEAVIADCVWAAGIMLANKATLGAKPCTRAEREALARAGGKPEGQEAANLLDLQTGLIKRYGWTGRIVQTGSAGIATILQPGMGAVVLGYYAALPPHFQRFDPGFAAKGSASYHATYVEREDDRTYWWIDPLFHGEPGYHGERIAQSYLATYATAYGSPARLMVVTEGEHFSVTSGPVQPAPPQEVPLGPFPIDPADKIVDVIVGRQLYQLDLQPRVKASNVVGADSPVGYRTGGVNYRAVKVPIGGIPELVLVKNADCSRIVDPPPPVTDCTAAKMAYRDAIQAAIAGVPI